MEKLKDLYTAETLQLRRPNVQWFYIQDMTPEEFISEGLRKRFIGHGTYKRTCDIICRDGHFDRRHNSGDGCRRDFHK